VVLTAPANEREMMPRTSTAAIDLGALPSGPCPGCGGRLWRGVSVPFNGMERLDAADVIVALNREL
jgi:hypothetical protein